MNLKLYYTDNVERPHESTSVEESKKLHASRGDENERDADRSALNEAGDSRKKKKCQDEKATGNGKAGDNGQLLHVLILQAWSLLEVKLVGIALKLKAKINNLL